MIRRPPRSTLDRSSAASDVYKRQLQGRGLNALAGFPEPGFDLDEIAAAPNIEIHFVDSSGIISWNFLGDTPDSVSYTHLRAHETVLDLVCRLLLDKKKTKHL